MKHPGFKAVQGKIAKKEGISKDRAGAILASAARKASPSAVKANPNLAHVPGVKDKYLGRHDSCEYHEKKMAKAMGVGD